MAVKRRKRKTTRKKSAGRRASQKVRRKAKNRRKNLRAGRYAHYVADAGVFCLTAFIGLAMLFAFIAQDLPDTSSLWRNAGGPKVTLLATDGTPLPVHGASMGAPVRLADLPPHAPNAVLAVEDRNFYHHFGINPVSILRAAAVNVRRGEIVQGGSTITQQLAKNVFLKPDRTLKRKMQEFLLALWLERKFTKDEILTLYLNRVYFGAGAYGIDAASYRYFGKPAQSLSLGEAAVLAGLLKAPSKLAPTSNPSDAGRRGRLVIEQMVDAGFLERSEADAVIAQPIHLSSGRFASAAYFVDHVMNKVRARVGAYDADLIVRTTFDLRAQLAAETGFEAGLARAGAQLTDGQGALVMVDSGGAVRAMIGGRDYAASQFNRAAQARRQPGSAFKPFVFLAAAEYGAGPGARVEDAPIRIGAWSPDNYKSKYYGDVSYGEALALSLNAATLRVQERVGREAVRRVVRKAGWSGDLTQGPSLGLGVDAISPLDLAGTYALFANGGFRVSPYAIEEIKSVDGDVLYRREAVFEEEVASRRSIASVNIMMEGVVDWGTGKAAEVPGYRVAGKTGTTQNHRDAWFVGHAGGLVCAVWVGRDDNAPLSGTTGGGAPAMIWGEAMMRALPPRYVAPLQPAAFEETG
jgi:penicillin-binding protein 1A